MSNMENLSKGGRQIKRPAPLKMAKPEEVRQYRPPVITYTYSPKIINVDAAQFASIVQSLTGRSHGHGQGQKRKPEASPRVSDFAVPESPVFAASAAAAAASGAPQLQYSPLFSKAFPSNFPHLFSPLPSPNIGSPNFMANLPALSPSTYQSFDAFGSHGVLPSPGYGRLNAFPSAGGLPSPFIASPGSSNAFMEMAMMLARD